MARGDAVHGGQVEYDLRDSRLVAKSVKFETDVRLRVQNIPEMQHATSSSSFDPSSLSDTLVVPDIQLPHWTLVADGAVPSGFEALWNGQSNKLLLETTAEKGHGTTSRRRCGCTVFKIGLCWRRWIARNAPAQSGRSSFLMMG